MILKGYIAIHTFLNYDKLGMFVLKVKNEMVKLSRYVEDELKITKKYGVTVCIRKMGDKHVGR